MNENIIVGKKRLTSRINQFFQQLLITQLNEANAKEIISSSGI